MLRVGYVAPDGAGLQLVESDRPAATVISRRARDRRTRRRPASISAAGPGEGRSTGKNNQQALVDTGERLHDRGQGPASASRPAQRSPPRCASRRAGSPGQPAASAARRSRACPGASGAVQPPLADVGQLLAALPERQRLLQRCAARLQPLDDRGQLASGLLVAQLSRPRSLSWPMAGRLRLRSYRLARAMPPAISPPGLTAATPHAGHSAGS